MGLTIDNKLKTWLHWNIISKSNVHCVSPKLNEFQGSEVGGKTFFVIGLEDFTYNLL